MHKNIKYGTLQAILLTPNYYREEERVEQQAEELLKVVHLYDKEMSLPAIFPGGEQRRPPIARGATAESIVSGMSWQLQGIQRKQRIQPS